MSMTLNTEQQGEVRQIMAMLHPTPMNDYLGRLREYARTHCAPGGEDDFIRATIAELMYDPAPGHHTIAFWDLSSRDDLPEIIRDTMIDKQVNFLIEQLKSQTKTVTPTDHDGIPVTRTTSLFQELKRSASFVMGDPLKRDEEQLIRTALWHVVEDHQLGEFSIREKCTPDFLDFVHSHVQSHLYDLGTQGELPKWTQAMQARQDRRDPPSPFRQ